MADSPPMSTCIVELVAAELDRDPLELEPLQDVVDADSIDALFAHSGTPSCPEFSLTYAGCRVRIRPSSIDVEQIRTDGAMMSDPLRT